MIEVLCYAQNNPLAYTEEQINDVFKRYVQFLLDYHGELGGREEYILVTQQAGNNFYGKFEEYAFPSFCRFYKTFHFIRRATLALGEEENQQSLEKIDEKIKEVDEILATFGGKILDELELKLKQARSTGNFELHKEYYSKLIHHYLLDIMLGKNIEAERIQDLRTDVTNN